MRVTPPDPLDRWTRSDQRTRDHRRNLADRKQARAKDRADFRALLRDELERRSREN